MSTTTFTGYDTKTAIVERPKPPALPEGWTGRKPYVQIPDETWFRNGRVRVVVYGLVLCEGETIICHMDPQMDASERNALCDLLTWLRVARALPEVTP